MSALGRLAFTAVALLGLLARPAGAQQPRGFLLQTYDPPPAGDRFFAVPDATTPGHRDLAAALVLSWATDPLLLRVDGVSVPGGTLVHRQLWGFAQVSVGLGERFLVEATLPVALFQSGGQPLPDLARVASAGVGDLRLGGRWALAQLGGVAVAAALDLHLPTGSTAAFASDGEFRALPKLVAGGAVGAIDYGGELGWLIRPSKNQVITRTGAALTWAAAAAWRLGEFRVGPELFGRAQFEGTTVSPLEGLLGGHWSRDGWDLGLALGTGLNRAPGSAPVRVVTQVSWRPSVREKALRAAAERAAAERAAAERTEAERTAAEARARAEREAAESAALEQAARERAEAERLAAERAEAERAAALKAAAAPSHAVLTREKIEIDRSLEFETDQDVLRPGSEPVLRDVAAVLRAHPEVQRIRLEGHTDSQGAADHNTRLSERRAMAARRWLVEQGGIEAARLEAMGFGPSHPIAPNDTAAGRAKNRRVEFKIVEPK